MTDLSAVSYELKHVRQQSGARYGVVTTPHGSFETPIFMPVGTQATVKTMTPEELKTIGAKIILATPTIRGCARDAIVRHGRPAPLHALGTASILTDSGGFQIFSLAKPKDIEEEGVHFRSHIDGSKHFLTPEKSIAIQEALGSTS